MFTFIHAIRRLTSKVEATLRSLPEAILHPYRRELYYMRGPGPKWRAKHGFKHGLQPARSTQQIS